MKCSGFAGWGLTLERGTELDLGHSTQATLADQDALVR